MLQNLLEIKGVNAITKFKQKTIIGKGGSYCCEWCPDGSCLDWVDSPRTTCPFAAAC